MRDAGFTPSLRDATGILELLGDADDALARDAERALARVDAPVLPRLVSVATDEARSAAAPVRAGIARLFGRLATVESTLDAALPWLVAALEDTDPRVRRAAAHALGKHRPGAGPAAAPEPTPDVEAALLDAIARGQGAPELRVMVATLGKIGGDRALSHLRTLRTQEPELGRILAQSIVMLSRQRARALPRAIDDTRGPPSPAVVLVRCREGLEDLVREEIAENGGADLRVEVRPRQPGVVVASLTGPMRTLFAVRTMMSFAFEIGREPAATPGEVEAALVRAFTSAASRQLVETFTRGPVRYRIAWASGGHRRAAVWRCAEAIAEQCPGWINDPTDSTWEVVVREAKGNVSVELVPRALEDPRFTYRLRDVPAASHPTIAAALVRVAGVRSDDVVWDPFVGSGTELVERARAGPYAKLHGSDTDEQALDAARANFAAAGLADVDLARSDATTHAPAGVTLVLTNPPMGRRVARSAELATTLDRFVDHVAGVLSPGGRFVWLSPLPARTAERARLAGLALHSSLEVDMGGFAAQLQKFLKET